MPIPAHFDRLRSAALGLAILLAAAPATQAGPAGDRPSILYILADDLGYGDVRSLNHDSKIATPHIDRLAAQGIRFTDAHSGSAVCTPTRYGILTGRYAWRSRLQSGVLGSYSPPLIEPGRLTVAALLKSRGYRTACVGKWHLGLEWQTLRPITLNDAIDRTEAEMRSVDYHLPFLRGPTTLGFDTFFGISASLDMPPFLFLHDDRSVGLPTAERTYLRKGPAEPRFEAVDVLPALIRQATDFLESQAEARPAEPFFLYLALNAPHTPIVPAPEYVGRSGLGAYGDFVMQVDDSVGHVLEALERLGLDRSTLVVFTSDNGCSPEADFPALARHGHQPSGPFRGTKADIFEGGHRVPFLARWPGKIRPGSTCNDTICLTDLMATCAAIAEAKLPADAGEDSVNLLPDLLGTAQGPLREATVHHSINGSFAIRQGPWKLALCPDSGGWSAPRPGRPEANGLPPIQLYNLHDDPGERHNLQAENPDVAARLTRLLERYVEQGRSTPGPRQNNDRHVSIRRAG